jgi:hypothetical protein
MGRTEAEFSVVLRFAVGSNDRPCLEAHCLNNNGLGIDVYTTAQVGNYLDTFYDFTKIYDLQKVLQKYTSTETEDVCYDVPTVVSFAVGQCGTTNRQMN